MTDLTDDAAPAAPIPHVRLSYDRMTIALHWLTALLVLAQFATALTIDQAPPEWARTILTAHRSMGVLLWLVVAFRLGWRFTGMRLPPFPPAMAGWHILGVHLNEYALYALLLGQPVTGMLDTLYRGRAFVLFGATVPQLFEKSRVYAGYAHTLHLWGAWLLAAVVGAHALAALFHHFILKDGVLKSMIK